MIADPKLLVAVTIVSSNDGILRQCLDSLFQWGRDDQYSLTVYVVWNGPGRGGPPSPLWLRVEYPEVHVVESSTSGFEFNQNLVLKGLSADYVLIANDDLIFLRGSLGTPIAYLEEPPHRQVGILGIKLLNPDHTLQPSTYSFPGLMRSIMDISKLRALIPLSPRLFTLFTMLGFGGGKSRYWLHDRICEVDTFRGSYMLVRGAALEQVGLFDVGGGQETEWIFRFHKLGWKVVFFPEAEIIHLGSATVSQDPDRALIILRTYLTLFRKHRPEWKYRLFRGWCLAYFGLRYCVAAALRQRDHVRIARLSLQLARGSAGE